MYEYRALVERYERGKPVPTILSTTNLILTETGSNTGLCGVSWPLTKKEERKEGSKQASQQERKKKRNSDTTLITRKEQMIRF
jgi:hypothetical protein